MNFLQTYILCMLINKNEQVYDKMNKPTSAPSIDSDQPRNQRFLINDFTLHLMGS